MFIQERNAQMSFRYQTLQSASLQRIKYWANEFGELGYEVMFFEPVTNLFGKITKYVMVLERELSDD